MNLTKWWTQCAKCWERSYPGTVKPRSVVRAAQKIHKEGLKKPTCKNCPKAKGKKS